MSEAGVPGTARFEGLLEGPTARWDPDPAAVAGALRARGLPEDLLEVQVEGGRAVLQPRSHPYPRADFAADPAEALALALQDLLQERPGAAEAWSSSLRVISHGERTREEALLQVGADGVHLVRRERAWTPPPAPGRLRALRQHWWVYAIALIGVLAMGWLRRDYLLERWDYFFGGVFGRG